jgi:hypothetical protein
MPNDFETHALQKLLGLGVEDVQPMVPDFLNAMQMMPGVSGPDEQLQAMMGMVPDDVYASLASLLSPPTIAAGGVSNPQVQNTGLVRTQQSMQRPRQPVRQPVSGGRTNMDDVRAKNQRRLDRAKADREQQERLAKKKGKK